MFIGGAFTLFGGDSVLPASVSLTANVTDTTDVTVYSFADVNIGDPNDNRKIVITIGSSNIPAPIISNLDVEESNAIFVAEQTDALDRGRVELWQIDIPTESTANIVITYGSSTFRCALGVWRVLDAADTANDIGGSNADPLTDTLNIPAGGIAIGGNYIRTSGSPDSVAWTNLTEDFDDDADGATNGYSGASEAFISEQTGRTITADPDHATPTSQAMVIVSWGPA